MPENSGKGSLQISVTSDEGFIPISGATITITFTGNPDSIFESVTTDNSGQTETIEVPAPPIEYSQTPSAEQPYSEYNVTVTAPGFETAVVSGTQVLPDRIALQPIALHPTERGTAGGAVAIDPHTLYGDYPPKIPEAEIKPMDESGEIVLSQVVIPEYVVVHDGPPTDTAAKDYYVLYRDYIKNVASSEIYATWPESTIYANILAIMSFTLNRVYTEWYTGKGYSFTITSSTAYDQKFLYGRNIYSNIDRMVDSVFANYLSRPGVKQPIFTSYCDGNRTQCAGLSQWGSKALGDQGYSAIDIIHNYYGNDMYINAAEKVAGVPSSWPGYNLQEGSSGESVKTAQHQLNRIADNYPAIPKLAEDGAYGPLTAEAVKTFQKIFGLPQTGTIDYATWYKISHIYTAVARLAVLR
ncbi:MAG: peptidoglycan-binding protein [Lachnospiraceae bacterium]|jgi:hypothetical protein|nr:peptidoglycan-binding protein [Lachnospiraceae bacterium]